MNPTIRESIRKYQFQEFNGDAINTHRLAFANDLTFNEIINRVTTLFNGVQLDSHNLSINIHGSNIHLVSDADLSQALTYLQPHEVRIVSVKPGTDVSSKNEAPLKIISGRSVQLNKFLSVLNKAQSQPWPHLYATQNPLDNLGLPTDNELLNWALQNGILARITGVTNLVSLDELTDSIPKEKILLGIKIIYNDYNRQIKQKEKLQEASPLLFPSDDQLFFWAKENGILARLTGITDPLSSELSQASIMAGTLWPTIKNLYERCLENYEKKQLNQNKGAAPAPVAIDAAVPTPAPNPNPAPAPAPNQAQRPTHYRANRPVENRAETIRRMGPYQTKKSAPRVLTIREQVEQIFKKSPFNNLNPKK